MHRHRRRRLDADSHLVASDVDDRELDVVADHYRLVDLPREHQHCSGSFLVGIHARESSSVPVTHAPGPNARRERHTFRAAALSGDLRSHALAELDQLVTRGPLLLGEHQLDG
ncbi:MAG: hypothetical protein ACK56F_28840, partial [bacterium]